MASDNSMVTIDKIYLETLLRRAQFHTSENSDGTPSDDSDKIIILKKEHDALIQSAREYENLRRNLYKGGIVEETLNILIKDDTLADENGGCENGTLNISATHEDHDNSTAFMTQIPSPSTQDAYGHQAYTYGTPRNSSSLFPRRSQDYKGFQPHSFQYQQSPNHLHTDGYDDHLNSPDGIDTFDFETGDNSQTRSQRPTYEKFAQRTVLLFNLPDGTTYADICDAVRGGMLLDIYLRTHDHAASVSFLEQAHANEFLRHVKRNDLYIRSKRVDIRWSDRQFILPNHIANKVGTGATRNLIIHNCSPKHTEKVIRDDLEHIHNLVIIKVAFDGSNAFISTNSVHNAMFARTCMMSRGTYKSSKIEWDNDECAAPLARRPTSQSDNPPHSKKKAPLVNRFQILNIDREDGSESDTEGMGVSVMRATPQAGLVT
ncbi:d469b726-39d0-47d5-a44c-eb512512ba7d [Sclerotinia trifoliorum]|uniref:D469b726-39d0-47d5-a44c-eb512512ba7d n=1 Tax=Sclerotinia trifoliorum TaxID=28548 RepID=A0A8H2VM41_9HELO|nr:d469b726-39d0-47d5-a44c-eb512512ba7d [Sclerotinia trifoliorum]